MSEFKMSESYLMSKESTGTATEKLDAVLNYLNDNRDLAYHYGYGLPRRYSKPKDIVLSDQDVLNVLDKLERDNMVRSTVMGIGNGNSNSAEHYTISLDGEVLLQKGGYNQKIENEKTIIRHTKIKDNLLVIFSIVAGVSTFGLLILGFLEYYCEN
jgi:hypothetical protein